MKRHDFFSIAVTNEQEKLAQKLVEYSLKHHPIPNIWDTQKKNKTAELRLTGTLGEIIFADVYQLPRPTRSFGALDGQDFGKDFTYNHGNEIMIIDVKTMRRKNNKFYKNYVLNIPARNLRRKDSLTDYYYCISLHKTTEKTIASLIGYISKQEILKGHKGILYHKNTWRTRRDHTGFKFFEDTYEIKFEDLHMPILTKNIENLLGFKKMHLL